MLKLNNLKKQFNDKGYLVVRNIFNKIEINNLMLELNDVKSKVVTKNNSKYFHKTKDDKFNTIHNIQKYHNKGAIIDIPKKKILKKIVEKILNDKALVRNIEFFLKPKKTGMPSPFHQDNYYWNIISAKALNVWIACSKVNKQNGGLCYLEGSHKMGTIKHQISYSKGSSQKIPEFILKKLKFKKIFPILNSGDCLIHHPEIIHGSHRNKSNIDRIGFVVSFKGQKSKIDNQKLKLYKLNLKKNLNKIYS